MSVLSAAGSRERVRFGQWISATTCISCVLQDTALLSAAASRESFLSNTTLLLCLYMKRERKKHRQIEIDAGVCHGVCVCVCVCVCTRVCVCVCVRVPG